MNAQIYDALEQGNAFNNPLPGFSATSQDLISGGQQSVAGISSIPDTSVQAAIVAGGLTPAKLTSMNTMYGTANTGIGTLNTYGDQSVNEAYSRIGTSVSYKSGLKSIEREPTNCDLINNAFGVIQTLGRQWLTAMEDALSPITNKVQELYDLAKQGAAAGLDKIQALAAEVNGLINDAVAKVNGVIQNITDGIAAELAHIEDMVKKCLNFSFANVLSEWAKDICAGGVINNIGSTDLKNALK